MADLLSVEERKSWYFFSPAVMISMAVLGGDGTQVLGLHFNFLKGIDQIYGQENGNGFCGKAR